MTKKEIIIKAWMDLDIETPFGICDKTGWVHGYFGNGIDDIINDFGDITDQIDYDIEYDGVGKFRPKSLQGIENNNGWIKIEEKTNIKWNDSFGIVFTNKGNIYTYATYCNFDSICELEKITHFQQIIKPNKPLY